MLAPGPGAAAPNSAPAAGRRHLLPAMQGQTSGRLQPSIASGIPVERSGGWGPPIPRIPEPSSWSSSAAQPGSAGARIPPPGRPPPPCSSPAAAPPWAGRGGGRGHLQPDRSPSRPRGPARRRPPRMSSRGSGSRRDSAASSGQRRPAGNRPNAPPHGREGSQRSTAHRSEGGRSQSIKQPSRLTSAAERQSEIRPYSAIERLLISFND